MKARVFVSLKPTVLDPQGQTIAAALRSRGYSAVRDVRQNKVFDIDLDPALPPDEIRRQLEELARDVLANPVIEEFKVELG
jgi:phosphoribosylformylglycinamidine synthase